MNVRLGLLWFLFSAASLQANAKDQAYSVKWLEDAEAAYDKVSSYTAVFHKQQRVAGKLLPEETILLKFRKPFSLYMNWNVAPYKGCEVLYVEGWNDNRARVHRGGLLRYITRNLAPDHAKLMSGNLRPLTDTGIGFLQQTVAWNIRKAITAGEVDLIEHGEETVYGRAAQIREFVFPQDRAKGYGAYRMIICQDLQSRILIRLRAYDWNNQLFENYGYDQIDLHAGLTGADFDPEHADYRF